MESFSSPQVYLVFLVVGDELWYYGKMSRQKCEELMLRVRQLDSPLLGFLRVLFCNLAPPSRNLYVLMVVNICCLFPTDRQRTGLLDKGKHSKGG